MEALLIAAAVVAAALGTWRVARHRRAAAPAPKAIDPFTLSEPWRRHVSAAQSAQRRYNELVKGTPPGPLRDRLQSIGREVQHAVEECYAVARRGDELDDSLKRIDVASLDRQLARATDEESRASISAQLAAAGRLRTTRDDTDARLRVQVTRMGELTTLAAEVKATTGDDATARLSTGVDEVVTQLEGLRLALRELA